ncbi:helix-turn-helix domain-containing protein [Candidatus Micrarchaeota archaeon]|nr:helix-turn-helix domain-containing protein [Candidatus Micrarchaeota archaeon]
MKMRSSQDSSRVLEGFDLSPTAAKTYLALVELGPCSADAVAKRVGTYKPNVYAALDRLMELGLCTSIFEGKKRVFRPTHPDKLSDVLEENWRQQQIRHEAFKKEVHRVMPELSKQYESLRETDLFEVYKGRKGYKALISEIVRAEAPTQWKGFGNLQVQEFFPIEFRKWFKKTRFRLFATKNDKIISLLNAAKKTTDVQLKWLPEELYMPIVWVVFGNNVLILIYAPEVIALRIQSRQVVETFSSQFEYLWKKHSLA